MGGWLHYDARIVAPTTKPLPLTTEKPLDAWAYWEEWICRTGEKDVASLATVLGLEAETLDRLGCIKIPNGWGFPMFNDEKQVIGIRVRDGQGNKLAIKGSKSGIFAPMLGKAETVAYICEGPSDTAAALQLGFYAIGRPSCLGQEEMIGRFVRRHGITKAVIVCDNDTKPEAAKMVASGAERLRQALRITVKTWFPPFKDLRLFVNKGGTRDVVVSMVKDLRSY